MMGGYRIVMSIPFLSQASDFMVYVYSSQPLFSTSERVNPRSLSLYIYVSNYTEAVGLIRG